MKLLIDSSVFIAFFSDTDVFHKSSLTFFQKLSKDENIIIVLPVLVFLEVVNVLCKKMVKFEEERLLRAFNDYEKVDLLFDSAVAFFSLFKQVNLKTSDAIILACAKIAGATLVTWDEKFRKQAKKFVPAQTPKGFLLK